jgi:hypothetical protein
MTLLELLTALDGWELYAAGEYIYCDAPRYPTAEELAAFKEHKAALLARLPRAPPGAVAEVLAGPPRNVIRLAGR